MKNFREIVVQTLGLVLVVFLFTFISTAQQQQVQHAAFDVTNYRMDVTLAPSENRLSATVDVDFIPLEDTRTVSFELNGSLKIDSITRVNSNAALPSSATGRTTQAAKNPKTSVAPTATQQNQITFVQDQVGVSDLGPSVKIDLGETVTKGTPVTLRFSYGGVLITASGGPLLTKRLAYVGDKDGYLMYASRWFPFHNYAADQATSDITLTLPNGFQVVGFSDAPQAQTNGKYHFVQTKPALIGNFAYGRYTNKTLHFGDYELQFNTKLANDALVSRYGETLGRALEFYTKQYGVPQGGKRLVIAQIDDESLDFYSTQGMIFMADHLFNQSREITQERLQREAALQWWGLSVGLKSFDDAWLSQGLAEYSAFNLRESQMSGAQLDNLRRELLEKSLTFEQTASLSRTPAALDDQSTAYQYIMFGKGAFVFKLLRDTLGDQKFNQLLRNYLEQYRGKNASIDDFEKLTTQIAGQPMRYFFARWVESTGVPEFQADYQIIRTRAGKFIARGTVTENYDNLRLPLEVQLKSEGEGGAKIVKLDIEDKSADFNIESTGKPLAVVIDPNYKILRISDDLRVSSIARRGIEQFKEGNYVEAQQQFEAALKLDRSNSWVYYNLGLLFLEQRNYDLAIDNFKAVLGGDLRPDWLAVWSNIKMGNAYDAKGDRPRATAAYKRAEALGDDYDNAQDAVKRYQATPYDPKEKQVTAVK
ncbi:MAG: tetratricopeptide repeat protein [Acidobacteriota bacterium]|nr:tetratricopeptide repeat protein [Acidobacteriota bacterium]